MDSPRNKPTINHLVIGELTRREHFEINLEGASTWHGVVSSPRYGSAYMSQEGVVGWPEVFDVGCVTDFDRITGPEIDYSLVEEGELLVNGLLVLRSTRLATPNFKVMPGIITALSTSGMSSRHPTGDL